MSRQSKFKSFNKGLLIAHPALQAISLSETLNSICFSSTERQMGGPSPLFRSAFPKDSRGHCMAAMNTPHNHWLYIRTWSPTEVLQLILMKVEPVPHGCICWLSADLASVETLAMLFSSYECKTSPVMLGLFVQNGEW